MYSTELMRSLPAVPDKPILYVVYNKQMVDEVKSLLISIHGDSYVDTHVTIVPFKYNKNNYKDGNYSVYIDPTVFTYKNSWNQ